VCERKTEFFVVILLILVTSIAVADPPAGGLTSLEGLHGGAKVKALVDLVVARQRSLSSLEADFVQDKTSAMLLEPVRSSGRFRFKAPDRVRWDYDAPDMMIVVFAGETLTTYKPAEGVAERVSVPKKQRRLVRVLAGTQPLDEISAQFTMALSDPGDDGPLVLTLEPIHRTLKRKLKSVKLEIDRTLLLPVVVEYDEADGDSTRYAFTNMVIDGDVEDRIFDLDLGADVHVSDVEIPD